MARFLLGWEIGENRGHVARLDGLARALRRAGHKLAWAVSRIDLLDGVALPGEPAFQAPRWPGQHPDVIASQSRRAHLSMADTLADLGLGRTGAFGQVLRGWDAILAATCPDALFADFAPALIAASRGRVPSVAAGIGFALPPGHLPRFPLFERTGAVPPEDSCDEARLLDEANRGLASLGIAPLPGLPALFAADAPIVSAFRELDPYAAHRHERPVAPFLTGWTPPPMSRGNEIIAYLSERLLGETAVFSALDRIGLPVTAVVPGAPDGRVAGSARVRITGTPLPFAAIARRARLVVSNGNTGFVSAAMLAGLPQAVIHHDRQKQLVGQAVTALGLGLAEDFHAADWPRWSERLRDAIDDADLHRRAAALAPRLVARMHADPVAASVAALERLTGCSSSLPSPVLAETLP